jgi:hypothetical protein
MSTGVHRGVLMLTRCTWREARGVPTPPPPHHHAKPSSYYPPSLHVDRGAQREVWGCSHTSYTTQPPVLLTLLPFIPQHVDRGARRAWGEEGGWDDSPSSRSCSGGPGKKLIAYKSTNILYWWLLLFGASIIIRTPLGLYRLRNRD